MSVNSAVKLAAALCLGFCCSTSIGAEWSVILFDPEQEIFADKSSLETRGNYKKLWLWQISVSKQDGRDNTKMLTELDCKNKTVRFEYAVGYLGSKQVGSSNNYTPAKPIVPDTVGEQIYRAVCLGEMPQEYVENISIAEEQKTLRQYAKLKTKAKR